MADNLYGQGNFDSARTVYEGLLAEARQASDLAAQAVALTSLGLTAWRLGDHVGARRYGEEALAIKRRAGLDSLLFRSRNALGLLAWSEGRFFDAVEHYEAAFEVAEARAETANLAKASNNLALVLNDLGEFDRARRYFGEALVGARSVADTFIQARVLNNLGMLDHQVGNPRRAIEHLEQSRRLYAAVGDVTGDQNALAQLGNAHAALGSPGEALAYLDSALIVSRRHGLRQEEANNLELLASIYSDAGDARRALRLLEQAAVINEELALEFEKGLVLRRQATVHGELGAYEAAARAASEALALHQSMGATREELSDLVLLAELAAEAGDRVRAAERMAAAGVLAAESGSRAARVEVALGRARLAEASGDWPLVLATLEALEEDLREAGYGDQWAAAALLARAHARLGSPQMAAEAGLRAVHAAERVRAGYRSGVLRTSFLAERQRTYFDLVSALLALGRADDAFQVADRARGRALLEHLAVASTEGRAPERAAELAEGERLLRQIDTLVVRLEEVREYPPEENGMATERRLLSELGRKRSDYEAIVIRAEAADPGTALLGGSGAHPRAIFEALRPDEALLQYLVGEDRILLFVATREGLRVREVSIDRESLIGRIRLARDLLSRPAGGSSSADGAAEKVLRCLYELLVGTARGEGLLEGKARLILVPHAELSYVPFGALIDPSTGRYLAADYALIHLPSSSALPVLRSRALDRTGARRERPVAYAPFPQQLPATAGEARAFEQALGEATVRIGRRATEENFRASLAAAPVVHAATHGVLNPRNPMFTRVELARGSAAGPEDDGRLEMHELIGRPVSASLVFLSGCETGLGPAWSTDFAAGEDYATLAQAFLYAGARNVVATLWRIEDEGAAAFAAEFYEALADLGPVDALAAAQRALMDDPRFGAPFYWAAYRLSGA